MIVVTSNDIPGKQIVRVFGVARGSTVRCKPIGEDLMAALRNLVGGEITEYTSMIAEAREQAFDRMVNHANEMGANAVVAMRFSTAEVVQGAAEILAYGTAVWIE